MTAPAPERVRELVAEIRDDVADDRGRKWTVLHLSMAAVDDLLAAAEAWADAQGREYYEPLAASACSAIRKLLHDAEVPTAAFIDDHVGNLIVLYKQAQERIAELEAERDRLRAALQSIENCQHAVQVGRSPFRQACDIARAALEQADG